MILKNQTTVLKIDSERGVISSLKYKEKEFIGKMMPIFQVAFRSEEGKLIKKYTDLFGKRYGICRRQPVVMKNLMIMYT